MPEQRSVHNKDVFLRNYNYMMHKSKKGFSLIELLIVITIIAVLSIIVVIAINGLRTKSRETQVRADIGQLRNLAESFYASNCSSYASDSSCLSGAKTLTSCFSAPSTATCAGGIEKSVATLLSDINAVGSGPFVVLSDTSTPSEFCMSKRLSLKQGQVGSTNYLCVDESGKFKEGATKYCLGTVMANCP